MDKRSAAWHVPNNPHPLCRNFISKPEPAEFWCINCGWNLPMHGNEDTRSLVAAELANLARTP